MAGRTRSATRTALSAVLVLLVALPSLMAPNVARAASAPEAAWFYEGTGNVGEFAFFGFISAATSPGATITSYQWDFGDGGTATGVTPTHTYNSEGIHTVILTVTDSNGSTDTAQHDIVPRLVVGTIETVPDSPQAGEAFSIRVQLKNEGGITISAALPTLSVSPGSVATLDTNGLPAPAALAPGTRVTYEFPAHAVADGLGTASAQGAGTVNGSPISSSTKQLQFKVGGTVTARLGMSPAQILPGGSTTVRISMANTSLRNVSGLTATFSASSPDVTFGTVSPASATLSANSTLTFTVPVTASKVGLYGIQAELHGTVQPSGAPLTLNTNVATLDVFTERHFVGTLTQLTDSVLGSSHGHETASVKLDLLLDPAYKVLSYSTSEAQLSGSSVIAGGGSCVGTGTDAYSSGPHLADPWTITRIDLVYQSFSTVTFPCNPGANSGGTFPHGWTCPGNVVGGSIIVDRDDTVTRSDGWTIRTVCKGTLVSVDGAPTASCTATPTGAVGQFQFVASATDPGGRPLTYSWTYGDGTPDKPGATTTHTYAAAGHYSAFVTVTNDRSQSATGACAVDVASPQLGVSISLPGKDNGRVELDETFTVRVTVSASAAGLGSLMGLRFEGDALRLAPDAHLEIIDGPTPAITQPFALSGGAQMSFEYHVHVLAAGAATLATRVTGKNATGATVDSGDVTRNVSASPLIVTITPAKNNFKLAADANGKPTPEEVEVEVAVKNTSADAIDNVVVQPMDLAAADPLHVYEPFPAQITGTNDAASIGTIAAGDTQKVTRRVRVTGDGHMKLMSVVASGAGNAFGEAPLTTGVTTLVEFTIDGESTRQVVAGAPVFFHGTIKNVTNDRTVAITDPMKVQRAGNLLGGGLIAQAAGDDYPAPLIATLKPGAEIEFQVQLFTDTPTVADYDAGTAGDAEWTHGTVDFGTLWVRMAVEEEDGSWKALSSQDPCVCSYPGSVRVSGGSFGHFEVVIDTTEPTAEASRFGAAAFGLSVGALEGAQRRLSGMANLVGTLGRFVALGEVPESLSKAMEQSRLHDALIYLSEFAVWLPDAEADELAASVGERLHDAYAAFDKTVVGGIPRPEETESAEALSAVARDYIDHLRGAWRRGDPNEIIDAVMPAGGFIGEQATDMVLGEAVFEGLAHLATVPRYADLAITNWRDARTIAQMQKKLPSVAQQADELGALERSKSNFENLENAYNARRPLSDAELSGSSDTGAGLSRDTISTSRQWSEDNPNQIIVVLPNEPQAGALRDAGLAVGKIENIKPKSMATIEYLVFGGRSADRNCVILRDLSEWTETQLNAKVDELIAAGELAEEDRAVAKQILKKRNEEWKLFIDRGIKDPASGVVTPDSSGIGKLKAYDEAGYIPNQFRGEDNGVKFSGPKQQLKFKLEYYKDGELLPASRVAEADYVVVLQEHPETGKLVKIVGDDDGIFIGLLNGLGLPKDKLEAAYSSIWEAFNHPFSDTWIAATEKSLKAKLSIFSRYFDVIPGTKEAGKPLVAFVNGEAFAVKINPYLSRFDDSINRAYIKFIGLPEAVDPIHPGGWVNAVLRNVGNVPWPATFLRSFLHIPNAADGTVPPIPSGRGARVLRVNELGHVESWTPSSGWQLDPAAEAEATAGTVAVAPQTQVVGSTEPGAVRIEIATQSDMAFIGDWFEIGDTVVIDPGGPHQEMATISGFGSLIFSAPLKFRHDAGELISFVAAGQQPGSGGSHAADALLTTKRSKATVGAGIFNATGEGQALELSRRQRRTATFFITVRNVGTAPDRFTITGLGSEPGYVVRYDFHGHRITDSVVAGTYVTDAIAPGDSVRIRVRVRVVRGTDVAPAAERLITVTSVGDPTSVDAVRLRVIRRARR